MHDNACTNILYIQKKSCMQCLKYTFFIYFLFLNSNNNKVFFSSRIKKKMNWIFFFFIICLKILVCHWRLQIISFNNNSIFPFFYLTEKLFGEFLSWDLQDALSHLPLKSGQSVSIPVNISAKLDFSGQENLLHDLNDGKHPHDTHKQHHWGPFWFVPSNLRSISESASPESSHYNQDWLDCSLIDRKAVFTLACYGRSDPSEVIWNGVCTFSFHIQQRHQPSLSCITPSPSPLPSLISSLDSYLFPLHILFILSVSWLYYTYTFFLSNLLFYLSSTLKRRKHHYHSCVY